MMMKAGKSKSACLLCQKNADLTRSVLTKTRNGGTVQQFLKYFKILEPERIVDRAVACLPCIDLVETSVEIHRSFRESLDTLKSVVPGAAKRKPPPKWDPSSGPDEDPLASQPKRRKYIKKGQIRISPKVNGSPGNGYDLDTLNAGSPGTSSQIHLNSPNGDYEDSEILDPTSALSIEVRTDDDSDGEAGRAGHAGASRPAPGNPAWNNRGASQPSPAACPRCQHTKKVSIGESSASFCARCMYSFSHLIADVRKVTKPKRGSVSDHPSGTKRTVMKGRAAPGPRSRPAAAPPPPPRPKPAEPSEPSDPGQCPHCSKVYPSLSVALRARQLSVLGRGVYLCRGCLKTFEVLETVAGEEEEEDDDGANATVVMKGEARDYGQYQAAYDEKLTFVDDTPPPKIVPYSRARIKCSYCRKPATCRTADGTSSYLCTPCAQQLSPGFSLDG